MFLKGFRYNVALLLTASVVSLNAVATDGLEYSYKHPIQVGWIDGMNSHAYQLDFEAALPTALAAAHE